MNDALRLIATAEDPEKLRKISEKKYGLPPEEAIEYAYENVIMVAKHALEDVRRVKGAASK